MRTELSAKDEEEVLVWLSSTLGARITKIEEESGEPEAMTKAEREIPGHFASVPAARIEKFERFGKVIHAGESTVTALINTTTAIVYGAALATPPYDAAPAIILRERMESQRAQMVATFTQQAVEQFAYIYRGLSDEELGRYLAFAESPAGRRYHDATVKVLEDVLTHAALDMGRELARTAPSQPSRRS
jgi:hypothetical protein